MNCVPARACRLPYDWAQTCAGVLLGESWGVRFTLVQIQLDPIHAERYYRA